MSRCSPVSKPIGGSIGPLDASFTAFSSNLNFNECEKVRFLYFGITDIYKIKK